MTITSNLLKTSLLVNNKELVNLLIEMNFKIDALTVRAVLSRNDVQIIKLLLPYDFEVATIEYDDIYDIIKKFQNKGMNSNCLAYFLLQRKTNHHMASIPLETFKKIE